MLNSCCVQPGTKSYIDGEWKMVRPTNAMRSNFFYLCQWKWPMCCCCINRDENNNVKWMKVRLKVPSTEFSHCVEALKMLFPFLYSPHWNPIMGQEQSYQTISLFCSSFMFIHLFTIVVFYPANLLFEIEDDKKGRWHDKKINKRIISLTIYLLK